MATTVDFHSSTAFGRNDGSTVGEMFTLDVTCALSAVRINTSDIAGQPPKMRVYRASDRALLASVDSPGTSNGYRTISLSAPLTLQANTQYVLAAYNTAMYVTSYSRATSHTHAGTGVAVTLPLSYTMTTPGGDVYPAEGSAPNEESGFGLVLEPLAGSNYVPAVML